MSGLVVGGVIIPVSQSASRPRIDLIQRARALDGTYRAASIGTAKREWMFVTPPLNRQQADLYESVLSVVTAQACTGDLTGGSVNSLTYSEQFDNAAWTLVAATLGLNLGTSPIGTVTAEKLKEDNTNSTHTVNQSVSGLTNSTIYTFSCYCFPLERNWVTLAIQGKDATFRYAFFDVLNGVVGTQVSSPTAATIELVPSNPGWYRCALAATVATGGSTPQVTVGLASANGTNSYLGTTGNGVYVWGAQLNPGSTPQSYAQSVAAAVNTTSTNCFTEITGWTPVPTPGSHYVQLSFTLYEA